MELYYYIIIPVFIATLVYFLPNRGSRIIAFIMQLALFGMSVYNFVQVKDNGVVTNYLGGWSNGVGIALRADSEASIFIVMTTFLFLITISLGMFKEYIDNTFIFLFVILEALLITTFLSTDLFNIYIVIEISTIAVSILIMYKRDSRSVYDALIYFLSNILGMTFFLFGIAFIYKIFGVLDIYIIAEKMKNINDPLEVILPFGLLMTAACLKCAVLPLFSWLPKAHGTPSAPSIVSAILSGLYVKGGIYLFIRLRSMFQPVIDIDHYFLLIGVITAIVGVILAILQKDIKLILAYHTVSQLGIILVGICAGSIESYYGALYHCINHSIFKALLFIIAGIIIERYKIRNVTEIRGVFRRMPVVSIVAIMAIAGITGTPFFNGSISKYMIQAGLEGNLIKYSIVLVNFGTILSFCKFLSMFFGKDFHRDKGVTLINLIKTLPIFIMGLLCFLLGIMGDALLEVVFNYRISIISYSYLLKSIYFIFTLLLAIALYKYFLSRILKRLKPIEFELTFNHIALSIVVFFVITVIFGLI